MKHTFQARSIRPDDAENYVEWLKNDRAINLVDPKVYEYPTCISLVVDKDGESILMNSFHVVLVVNQDFTTQGIPMMEALAVKPSASPSDVVLALWELYDGMRKISGNFGVKELWLQSIDARMQKFLLNHGFEKVDTPLVRYKIDDEKIINDPLSYLVAHVTQVREVWWKPVDDEHQAVLLSKGFVPVVVPVFRMVMGNSADPLGDYQTISLISEHK